MLINSLINRFNSKRLKEIKKFRYHPVEVQTECLQKLLRSAQNTEYGREFDFSSINSVEQFRERLPVQTYEDVKFRISRVMRGEENVLWPGGVKWFAKSSGTTSDKSKYIPITPESLQNCHLRGGKDALMFYLNSNPKSAILKGKALTIGGSHQVNSLNKKSCFGDLSAILMENQPIWVKFIRTPTNRIAMLGDWEEKIEKIYRTAVNKNVTNLVGVPSWNLVFLKYVLQRTGKPNLLEIWPNLELFFHGGVSFKPYEGQFKKIIPSEKMKYLETYNASEGFFGVQDRLDSDDMLLMLDYDVFYEFIPMDEFDGDKPNFLTVGDVRTNTNYAMVISTNSGLWRYILGDTVVFTSLYPHKIKVTGRTKHFINAFGEELIIENAEKGLREAGEKTGSYISDFTAAPIFMSDTEKGRHEWLIEFDKPPHDMEQFAAELDKALKAINSDYEAKRYKNITLAPPIVHNAKPGLFYNWLKEKGKLGGQNKVPRLSNTRQYIDELLDMNKRI